MKHVGGELTPGRRFICRHQLSWPRRTPTGKHYQICVHCGTRFGYDWEAMRRLRRLPDTTETQPCAEYSEHSAMRWVCRERRIRCCLPVLYRIGETDQWQRGECENVSMSGLLFRADEDGIAIGTLLELVIEEPRELTCTDSMQVHCRGTVVRTAVTNDERQRLVACVRRDYHSAMRLRAA